MLGWLMVGEWFSMMLIILRETSIPLLFLLLTNLFLIIVLKNLDERLIRLKGGKE